MPGITRRRLLELGGVALAGGAATLVARGAEPRGGGNVTTVDEYARFDGLGLADLVRRGEVSAGELLELALERLEAVNPRINAVVVRFEQQARRQIERGLPQGPFRGVPFLLKDLHAHLKGTVTTTGSRLYRDRVDQLDTELVRRHLRAGQLRSCRCQRAMRTACSTSWRSWTALIDQPTTRREYRSITTQRYNQSSAVHT